MNPECRPISLTSPMPLAVDFASTCAARMASLARLNALAGRDGAAQLRTIALYTAVDRHAMFVREADEAVLIGPDDPDQAFATSPYLDYAELERGLRVARADAVWPGWGFVSEKADFARLCRELGIVFVGPSPEVMEPLPPPQAVSPS